MRLSLKHVIALIAVALIIAVVAISCNKKSPEAQAKAASKASYDLLSYIPSNSPYFFGGLEAAPQDVIDKFGKLYSEIGDSYWDVIKLSMEDEGIDVAEAFDTESPWGKAVIAEFFKGDEFNKDVFKNFGFSMKTTGAIYGNGLMPVMRWKIEDPNRFKETIARIEKNAGEKLDVTKIGKSDFWTISPDDAEVAVFFGLQNDYLVATFSPTDVEDTFLKELTGETLPQESLSDTKYVQNIMRDKGYLPYSIGFIDLEKMSKPFLNEPTGFNKTLFALIDEDKFPHEELSQECRNEYQELAKVAPRMLFGTTKYDADDMNLEYLLEVRPDLAKDFPQLTAPVPGLGDATGLFSFGFSFNLENMQKYALKQVEAIKADPFECEKLQDLNDNAHEMEAALNNPAAGFVQGLRGVNFVVSDVDKDVFSELFSSFDNSDLEAEDEERLKEKMIENFGGYALLSVDNSKNLYNLAKMFSPEIAELDLKADGTPKLVNDVLPTPSPVDIYAAMQDEAFVFSAGKGAKSKFKDVMKLKSEKNAPLMSYSVDYDMYMGIFMGMFENEEFIAAMEEDGEDPRTFEAVKKMLTASYGILDTATFNIDLREDGVAIEYDLKMK